MHRIGVNAMTQGLPRSVIEPKNPRLNASRNAKLPHVPGICVGDYIFLSGMTPIDPQTGERNHGPIAEQVRTTLANMQHMLGSAGSSLERVVRVHLVLADISNPAEWIACSANSSQSIRRRAPPGPCSCASATATGVRGRRPVFALLCPNLNGGSAKSVRLGA